MGRAIGLGAACAAVLLLVGVGGASAAVRYAAPGGTGADPCADPAKPCSIFTAASASAPLTTLQAGDEVILAPGEYTDAAEDLGGQEFVQLAPNIELRGEDAKPRPRIVLENHNSLRSALLVEEGDVVSHLEITTEGGWGAIEVYGGTVEGLVARAGRSEGTTCFQSAGTIRDSACLATGERGVGVGENAATSIASTATLRNVTAVSTGELGIGLEYGIYGSGSVTVDAKSVIAQGDFTDIRAIGGEFLGGQGHATINLDHSDYGSADATFVPGGGASVTPAGSGTNIVGEPQLASDGYHELSGSATIDLGAVDGSSGATDVDGQDRTIGAAPDIGADELADPTSVTVSCDPSKFVQVDDQPVTGGICTAIVRDEGAAPASPSGSVAFSSNKQGAFGAPGCELTSATSGSASCGAVYTPSFGTDGTHVITATYAGDGSHDGSRGTTSLTVEEAHERQKVHVCLKEAESGCGPTKPFETFVHLTKKPGKKTKKRLAVFAFGSKYPEANFTCGVDTRRLTPCGSPFRRRVGIGRHEFRVRATLPSGETDGVISTWRVLKPKKR